MEFQFVASQMLMVSLPILLGWAVHKLGFLDDQLDSGLSRLVMNIGLPCTILSSLGSTPVLPETGVMLLIMAATLATYVVAIVIAVVVTAVLRVPDGSRGVYQFAMAFGNCGFIGLPVISAIFGDEALLYAAISLIPANFALFSAGAIMFDATSEQGLARRLRHAMGSLKSPTLVMSVVVFVLAMLGISDLGLIGDSVSIVGQMTTPLALLVTGSSLANYQPLAMLGNWRAYVACAARLLIIPLASLAVARLFPLDTYLLGIVVIDCSMPVATAGILFCLQHDRDVMPMLQTTFLSIIGSIATIPLVTVLIGS
ncbi:AEC family transporter [Collinsella sp. An2]|uniref:AEC family transporter n=1 Tax=Collinsella sp. An2 TaxID=1965585 RepID=UPI001302B3F0|nr:AEC family transporter [Collinsella sp. An2]